MIAEFFCHVKPEPKGIRRHFGSSVSTKDALLADSSIHAGRKPLRTALRTDLRFDHAAQ